MAISVNSPFWRGLDTGFASYRSRILAARRSYGIPPYFEDWDDFVRFFRIARRAGAAETFRDFHWDLRPHPDIGTLEVRVLDGASSVVTTQAVVAFVRALIVFLIDHVDEDLAGLLPRRVLPWLEHLNRFAASRVGLDADFVIDDLGTVVPLRAILGQVVDVVRPAAQRLGDGAALGDFERLMESGGDLGLQRRLYEEAESPEGVTRGLRDSLLSEIGSAAGGADPG